MRIPVDPKLDRFVFRKSADRTKAVNIRPTVYRGGIRF